MRAAQSYLEFLESPEARYFFDRRFGAYYLNREVAGERRKTI